MTPLIIDFETYFDSNITLKKLTYTEYVLKTTPLCVTILHNSHLQFVGNQFISEILNKISWENTILVGHNLLFDALVLKYFYNIEAAEYCDTLGLARLLYPSSNHSLEQLSLKFCPHIAKQKEALQMVQGKTWDQLNNTQQKILETYNKNDVLITEQIYNKLLPHTPAKELKLIDHTIKLWLNPRIRLDKEKVLTAVLEEKDNVSKQLTDLKLNKEDIRSDRKFYNYLVLQGYEPPTKWSLKQQKWVPTFAKNDTRFTDFYDTNPELASILDLKRTINSNIQESRAKRLITLAELHEGKIPIAYNYCGTFTGRFSGANKTNLQNLPRAGILRNSLLAPDNYHFIVADLSQIEARILAWLAGEEKILEAFRNKKDLYCEVASLIYNRPINAKENPQERFIGKSAALGLGYGMGPQRFNTYCKLNGGKVDEQLSQYIVQKYRQEYNKIPTLWSILQRTIPLLANNNPSTQQITNNLSIKNDYIILPSNRILRYEGLYWDDETWRLIDNKKIYGAMIVENVTQAIARDILCEYILQIDPIYPVVMHTHDEIITLVKENEVNDATEFIKSIMTTPPIWAINLPINISIANNNCYGRCK